MSKINELREIFKDVRYRAGQNGFDINTHFDRTTSAIRIVRRVDSALIYENAIGIKDERSRQEQVKSQISVYESFISYMAFYGIFQVAFAYDDNKAEILKKEKEEKESKDVS